MRHDLEAEKARRQRSEAALRAEMEAAATEAAEALSDAINGTAEKAETRLLREQTVAAKKASAAAQRAVAEAEAVAQAATAAREADSLRRVAAQRELQRLQAEQAQMVEAAARAASVEDGVRCEALRTQAATARAQVRDAKAETAAVKAAAEAEMVQAAEAVQAALGSRKRRHRAPRRPMPAHQGAEIKECSVLRRRDMARTQKRTRIVSSSSFERWRTGVYEPAKGKRQPWWPAATVAPSVTHLAKALQHAPAKASALPTVPSLACNTEPRCSDVPAAIQEEFGRQKRRIRPGRPTSTSADVSVPRLAGFSLIP